MRILLADKLASFVPGRMQDLGGDVDAAPELTGPALTAHIRETRPEVLVVRSTKVTAADIEAGPELALVIRAGAGVNTIDLAAASARGVYVANCPGKNAAAVAELTIGHLINLDRRIADNVQSLREGRWEKKRFGAAKGLRGRTLAVLGCGTIGQEVIGRAQALGMQVVGWSRSLTPEGARDLGVVRADTPEKAASLADAVTVHLSLTPETRGRIGASIFDAMRRGAFFVNTSRGEVIDQGALLQAIRDKDLRAGLDVFADEPSGGAADFSTEIAAEANVYGTHHIGASTVEASEAVAEEVVRITSAYAEGLPVPNCVNLASESHGTHVVVVRHADRVGVLAHVLNVIRRAGMNVQEMQNIVFSGGHAACARIAVIGDPDQATVREIAAGEDVYAVTVSTQTDAS
ncbi:MAG: hydroxyacid dehydrogenase [Deltaproteobacteria bacterium]|nr:hydroxyacid dehydrogenase [Deltaproteobacteria bacterium]